MGAPDRPGQGLDQPGGGRRGERPVPQPVRERPAGEVLEGEERPALGVRPELVDLDDVRVRQPGDQLGLGQDARSSAEACPPDRTILRATGRFSRTCRAR